MTGTMGKLAQVLANYRTSTPFGSGLNSHMMKSRKLIGAQFFKIQTSYLRKLSVVFNQPGLFLFILK